MRTVIIAGPAGLSVLAVCLRSSCWPARHGAEPARLTFSAWSSRCSPHPDESSWSDRHRDAAGGQSRALVGRGRQWHVPAIVLSVLRAALFSFAPLHAQDIG